MTVQEANPTRHDRPTETAPEAGAAAMLIEDKMVVLSFAERWVEPTGEHVIRSAEFDVFAGADSFQKALVSFVDNLWEYALYLSELDERADNEEEMFRLLAPRLLDASRTLEHCLDAKIEAETQRPVISLNLSRKRSNRHDWREWLPSKQLGSPLPSAA